MPTEIVIITGQNLKIDADNKRIKAQPLPTVVADDLPPEAEPLVTLASVSYSNPFWSDEANAAAEKSDERPKDLAKRWANHRIDL